MYFRVPVLVALLVSATSVVSNSAHSVAAVPHSIGLTWRQPTTLPQPLARPAVAVGHDGNIYVFGGRTTSGESNATFIYHPSSNTWTEGADMPTAREGAQAVTLPDGRIVVLGGASGCYNHVNFGEICAYGTVYKAVEAYSPNSNRWSKLAPMQTPRYRFAAVWFHGQIYALGGANGSEVLPRVEAYNPGLNRWTYTTPLPQAIEAPVAVVDAQGRLNVIGGFNGTSVTPMYYNDLFVYDGNTWASGPSLLQGVEDAQATLGADGRIYVIGGFNAGDLSTVQVYRPGSGSWSTTTALPVGRCCAGAVTLPNGQIYVLGGDAGQGASGMVEEYGPTINVMPAHAVRRDTRIAVTGSGFAPYTNVKLYWGKPGSKLVGIGATNGSGAVRGAISFRIPHNAQAGPHRLTAVDDLSRYPLIATVIVIKSSKQG